MKKRALLLRTLLVAIMLPLVMGACTSWQQHQGTRSARTVLTITNGRGVPNYAFRNPPALDARRSNFAKWGRGGLALLGFAPSHPR